jgi:2-polyprenyl-3-methyl-5-hydroxy-6-metoxy-1,4-benzoquinol methylase
MEGDAEKFATTQKYDTIVSFETIEHLNDFNAFLLNVFNSLNDNGEFIVSTPISKITTNDCNNLHHKIEWSFLDFHKVLSSKFDIKDIYLQSIILYQDLNESYIEKFKRWLTFKKYKERTKLIFEKYSNQYEVKDMVFGYQIVHCCKRNV